MLSLTSHLLASLLLGGIASGRDIPTNVAHFYDSVVAKGKCSNPLAGGFHSSDGDSGDFTYCGDHLDDYNIIYIQGRHGALANLDIDCDGIQGSDADDGRCKSSEDTQSITSFQWIVEEYGTGQKDLDSNIHPYVVFGNTGTKKNWPTFDPRDYGIKPLSVMAVVCGKKLIYGIWGDENGDDGEEAMVGETSLSLGTACFGKEMNGDNGYDPNDVLYIGFPGKAAVPGADGAKWNASNYATFEQSITALGDQLIARIGYGSYGGSNGTGRGNGTSNGHGNNGTSYGNGTSNGHGSGSGSGSGSGNGYGSGNGSSSSNCSQNADTACEVPGASLGSPRAMMDLQTLCGLVIVTGLVFMMV